jgi:tetratricopeptide (TPR) repeat protein
MKRVIALGLLLAVAAAAGAALYYAAQQERAYRAQLARGEAALAEDQISTAVEAYSGALTLRPDSMLAHLRRGEAYQRRNELDAATLDFRLAADLDPSSTRALEALGDVLYRRSRFAAAIEAYDRRLQLDSQSARVAYKLALARYRDGNIDGALGAAREAIRVNDALADAHYLIGLCLRDRKQLAEAAAAFEKAAERSPGLIAAREELADAFNTLGRKAEALEQLQLIAMLDRTRVERQVAVGLAQSRAGQEELAVLTLGNALERAPDDPLIYAGLGQVWLNRAVARNDRVFLRKALEALERAASAPAATSDVLASYARALLMDNQVEAAERALEQATLRFPIEPSALPLYATVAERLNHFDSARTALTQYAALVQDDPDAAQHAAAIQRLSRRTR